LLYFDLYEAILTDWLSFGISTCSSEEWDHHHGFFNNLHNYLPDDHHERNTSDYDVDHEYPDDHFLQVWLHQEHAAGVPNGTSKGSDWHSSAAFEHHNQRHDFHNNFTHFHNHFDLQLWQVLQPS